MYHLLVGSESFPRPVQMEAHWLGDKPMVQQVLLDVRQHLWMWLGLQFHPHHS
jgi:anthranilate/para-aminobenzoate synthase component II